MARFAKCAWKSLAVESKFEKKDTADMLEGVEEFEMLHMWGLKESPSGLP